MKIENLKESSELFRSENLIPEEVTQSILTEAKISKEMLSPKSAIIEDFIIKKLNTGATKSEEIIDAFNEENVPEKIQIYARELRTHSQEIDWDSLIDSIEEIRNSVMAEMKSIGFDDEQIEKIKQIDIEISSDEYLGPSTSSVAEDKIVISTLQIIRKAVDYETAFSDKNSFNDLVKAFFRETVAHEIGHQVDKTIEIKEPESKGFSVNIPYEWNKTSEFKSENQRERFAEYWAQKIIENNPLDTRIIKKGNALLVASFDQMWQEIQKYNSSNIGFEIDLLGLLRDLRWQLDEKNLKENDPAISDSIGLMDSRITGYGSVAPENYAVPYTRDLIEQAIKGEINKK